MILETRKLLVRATALLAASTALACGGDDDPTGNQLGAPAGVTATATSASAVRVTWGAVPGAQSYIVQRAPQTGDFQTVSGQSQTSTTFDDASLSPGTPYRYRVAAVNGSETSGYSPTITTTTLAAGRASVDVSGNITANRTFFADTIYRLSGIVQVLNGATLTIQPGTRITGAPIPTTGTPVVSALIIMRGAKIMAMGTRDFPIVMTSAADSTQARPGDWGGLVIVGRARSNRTGRVTAEGPAPVDTIQWTEGTQDDDDSGELHYVRVEFAGAAVVLNSELNAISMYAVGSGTEMDHLEAFGGLDDHFEWFGGTVSSKYLVSYESGDDHFDAAEGHRGRHQYLIGLQTRRLTPRQGSAGAIAGEPNGFEVDGCGSTSGTCAQGYDSSPFTMPFFANFTIVGPGPGVLPVRAGGDGGVGLLARRGTGGTWVNGIIARWPEAAISVFDPQTDARLTTDSLDIRNVLLTENSRNFDAVGASNRFGQETKFAAKSLLQSAAGTTAASLYTAVPAPGAAIGGFGSQLDYTPAAASAARTGGLATFAGTVAARAGTFVSGTAYVGAADPNATDKWWTGWTRYFPPPAP